MILSLTSCCRKKTKKIEPQKAKRTQRRDKISKKKITLKKPRIKKEEKQMIEKTFAIIKPDAVSKKNSGKIIDIIEDNSFNIVRMEKVTLTKDKAEEFYAVHKDKPFFGDVIEFMTSGPIIVIALEKENAVTDWRNLMGATDSKKAAEGTIRNQFGTDIMLNATHGSDSAENAKKELSLFFPNL